MENVQAAELRYRTTSDEYRANIERDVEERVKQAFEDARGHRTTDWNRAVGAKLKPLLRRFEEHESGVRPLTAAEHDAALRPRPDETVRPRFVRTRTCDVPPASLSRPTTLHEVAVAVVGPQREAIFPLLLDSLGQSLSHLQLPGSGGLRGLLERIHGLVGTF